MSSFLPDLELDSSIEISNQASELARVQTWLDHQRQRFKLPERIVFQLDMLLNEALPNIFSYAFEDEVSHTIKISLENKRDNVMLQIIDDGISFNPFAWPPYEPSKSLESAAIDGRGIHLIKSFSDVQEYQRLDGFNIIRLSIFLTTKSDLNAAAISA
jgi:serine/threonine-protein kinase RsbW